MNESIKKVKSYLDSDSGKVELFFILRMIQKHFNLGSAVLDLGGGSGRVSSEMAKLGYDVVLADLSDELLASGKEKIEELNLQDKVTGFYQVNVTDLSLFKDSTFDSIYCAGPFYHITNIESRDKALSEIYRILKPDGKIIINIMPKISGIRGLFYRMANAPEHVNKGTVSKALSEGIFQNTSNSGFQEGFYFNIDDIEPFFTNAGFCKVDIRSIKGIVTNLEAYFLKTKSDSPDLFKEMLNLIDETASREDVLSFGDYVACIFQKSKAK
jgi:ubiquinone/menaquinone biosynthesis C-methylase UbiE